MAIPRETDFVIVGAGIAGLRAAIGLASAGRVLVLTKEALWESNTNYAQGGIAVAMGGEEDVSLHLEDTMNAGDGLVNREAAAVLVEEGPRRVEELLQWGTGFDRENGELMLTREGAHSRNRILHAHGDATGAEIGRALLAHAQSLADVQLEEWAMCVDLLVEDGEVFSDTTNPAVATGDGIAMACRAGADIEDMEFYQFHPTALNLPGVPRFLLSEALRGEGAWLRNAQGERFMERYHPLLELAPRDVVARAITRESFGARPGETLPVYLDMRHVTRINPAQRFPGITAFLHQHGLDLSRNCIPVRPAAHYLMGGVRTSVDARASLPRLYAAGEAACTGVHGANRLASNSLLEGLVFGARAANQMRNESALPGGMAEIERPRAASSSEREGLLVNLQQLMWQKAGLLRDGEDLREAKAELGEIEAELPLDLNRASLELRSLHAIGTLIVDAALAREESRGAHYRKDFPQRDDERFGRHSVASGGTIDFMS
jgi:L-aspartate oxidase